MLKKLLPSLLTIAFLFLSFLPLLTPTHAVSEDIANDLLKIYCDRRKGNQMNLETWYGGKCDPDNLEESIGFSDMIILDIYGKIVNEDPDKQIFDPKHLIQLLGENPQSIPNNGAIAGVGKLISIINLNPPASSLNYIASVKSNLQQHQLVKPALAASPGYGFQALEPLLPIWKAFRNIAYFFFIIAFIAYGFMIMFKIKINPQTVISIQLALPKLIVTLLLITFSYAIAGLVIDLFYLVFFLILSVLATTPLLHSSIGAAWGGASIHASFLDKIALWFSGYGFGFIGPTLSIFAHLFYGGMIPKLISGILSLPSTSSYIITYALATTGIPLILMLIIAIAILYTLFKTFWMLLKSYVYITLSILFSPLILLGNVLPGSKSFGNWLKGIFAEFSVFLSTMIMFLFSFYFLGPFKLWGGVVSFQLGDLPSGDLWIPPPLSGQAGNNLDISFLSSAEGKFALLGLGIFLMIPKLAEMIKNALQIKDLGYGSALGDALKFGTDPFGARKGAQQYGLDKAGKHADYLRSTAGGTGAADTIDTTRRMLSAMGAGKVTT
ncbi:hypothetical protein KJ953_03290 [Patescibacteria group bacterium]|nr:hypothetical protein [Patescibacteria group bacterium]MBU1256637.1 hypothetical protein [Patescibacteria group bacterium]MBU1457141.1 hypothetical protein [Patescibacteria group bacterium]